MKILMVGILFETVRKFIVISLNQKRKRKNRFLNLCLILKCSCLLCDCGEIGKRVRPRT